MSAIRPPEHLDAAPGAALHTSPGTLPGGAPPGGASLGEPDLAAMARDWATIWHSEAAAMATDRELREIWEAWLATALGAPASSWPRVPPRDEAAQGAVPGAAPASAAPAGKADAPGPMRRRGPRPLSIHLAAASLPAIPSASTGPLPADRPGDAVRLGPDAGLLAGIAAYRRHPFRRALPDPPRLWQEGDTRLLDYSAPLPGRAQDGAARTPVLFVPSLVNRAQVLDLLPGRSLLRWLASQGLRTMLLDWGWPGAVERRFTLTDYIAGRLERAVASLGRPVILAGYCMGGLLCTALATRRPGLVAGLVLLATPWDFHAVDSGPALAPELIARTLAALEPTLALTGALGVDALQTLFELAAPGAVAAKYRSFARTVPAPDCPAPGCPASECSASDRAASDRARCFVAIEDWLADGVPLAAAVARECLGGWYSANSPARGQWRVAGRPVAPGTLRLPSLAVVPAHDRIVPAGSALALARALPGATMLRPAAGHVGMIVGSRAERELWMPLRDWLLRHGA